MEKTLNDKKKPHAIVVAFPLQGHVIPTVQLAIKLATKGFSITFINSQHIHHHITLSNPAATPPAATTTTTVDDIFAGAGLDIEYVTISDGLPVAYDRSLNHDNWMGAMMHCYPAHVEDAIGKIVRSRSSITCCLVADTYFVWASKVAKKFGLLYVSFWTEAALVLDVYFHLHLLMENGHVGPGARKDTITYIPGVKSIKPTDLMSYLQEDDITTITHRSILTAMDDAKRADFILGNTAQELEAQPISALQAQIPFYAIGPLFPPGLTKGPVATSLWAELDCIEWLDTKPPKSVLYVSFGSYAHITKEEMVEIAEGIKLSGVTFLWVIRPDMVSSDDPNPLPVGFRDEVGDRGMIVTWTRQMAVLCHDAIGGFLSHCGWNSVLESIWCGIPLLCFPLLTDQFTNRKLVVDDWRIGIRMCDEKDVTKEEVSQKIKLLIGGTMGIELKSRINEVRAMLQKATSMEGSSQKNVDRFIEDLILSLEKKCKI